MKDYRRINMTRGYNRRFHFMTIHKAVVYGQFKSPIEGQAQEVMKFFEDNTEAVVLTIQCLGDRMEFTYRAPRWRKMWEAPPFLFSRVT